MYLIMDNNDEFTGWIFDSLKEAEEKLEQLGSEDYYVAQRIG